MFWKLSAKLKAEGKIKPHPMTIRENGLSGIPEGQESSYDFVWAANAILKITDVVEGRVSATKLVYRTADTPGLKWTVEAAA